MKWLIMKQSKIVSVILFIGTGLAACGQAANSQGTGSVENATSTVPMPEITAAPALPADWVSQVSTEGGVRYALPPGWDVLPYESGHFDLREHEGNGWLEVYTLNESTRSNWGLTYQAGESADSIIAALLSAARDDGTFAEPYRLDSRSGLDGWGFDGEYTVYSERAFVGVIASSQSGLIIVGHENGSQADWVTVVKPLYLQIVSTFDF